jgi:hypothetical protein
VFSISALVLSCFLPQLLSWLHQKFLSFHFVKLDNDADFRARGFRFKSDLRPQICKVELRVGPAPVVVLRVQ